MSDQPVNRHYTNCQICGRSMRRPFMVINGIVFCQEHRRELRARRQAGVDTAQLDTAWHDTFDMWRERPPELEGEIGRKKGAMRLAFAGHSGDWLIFQRGYITLPTGGEYARLIASLLTAGRIKPYKSTAILTNRRRWRRQHGPRPTRQSDFLTINTRTGDVRRFVDLNEQEVLDDLQGIRVAPTQAEVAAFWGNPTPTGLRERLRDDFRQRVLGPGHRLLVGRLVSLATFTVYGLLNNPYGLKLQGTGWGSRGSESEVDSVTLTFSGPQERAFDVSTSRANSTYQPPEGDESFRAYLDEWLFRSSGLSNEQQAQAGPPTTWHDTVLLDGEAFAAQVYSWSQFSQPARFILQNTSTYLSGHIRGFSQEEIVQLLSGLTAINQREETLADYQRETDEYREDMMEEYKTLSASAPKPHLFRLRR